MKEETDGFLPSWPGEQPNKKEIKGVPFLIYLNGVPVEISKKEAMSIMAQIVNIIMYLDEHNETEGRG